MERVYSLGSINVISEFHGNLPATFYYFPDTCGNSSKKRSTHTAIPALLERNETLIINHSNITALSVATLMASAVRYWVIKVAEHQY